MEQVAANIQQASFKMQSIDNRSKNNVLSTIKKLLVERREEILKQNELDLSLAQVSPALYKRLGLKDKFDSLAKGIDQVIELPDPNQQVTMASQLDQGLELYRVSCPIGVLLIIFEARPEVVIQISCLAIKSGNAVILKGGKEAHHSNQILYQLVKEALMANGLPLAVELVSTRDEISELLQLDKYINLVIPRGSNALVRHVQNSTRIPVLGHADGICSIYVDETADIEKMVRIVVDSKTNYPAACNSVETVLIHSNILSTHLNPLIEALKAAQVTIRLASDLTFPGVEVAIDQDFYTEFLDLKIAIKSIDSIESAIQHINMHGSHHTDCIITESNSNANMFMSNVDSAGVYWNASTRFADGFRYGFGAEIGVSTNKTHARGPVGLEGLMIYKYRLYGDGHIVAEYNSGQKEYHRSSIPLQEAQARIHQ